VKAASAGVFWAGDLFDHDPGCGSAEPCQGVGEPLAEKGDVWAAGGVQDGDRVGHGSTLKPPLEGRVKG
jgi:hypothetical protein